MIISMKTLRIIGVLIFVFVGSWFCIVVETRLLNIDLKINDPTTLPLAMWLMAIISTLVFVVIGTLWLFKVTHIIPSAKNGFFFGLFAVILGLFLDVVLLIPYKNGPSFLHKYYAQPIYWTAFVLILLVCTAVGYIKAKKARKS